MLKATKVTSDFKMGKQRKFTNEIDESGLTEAEKIFLPKDKPGRKVLDDGFETIYEYDLLMRIVAEFRAKFNKSISSRISQTDIKKINSGLKDYVFSTKKKSYNLELLKCSLVKALESNILKHNYDTADESIQQMIPLNYFEKLDDFYLIDECWLIEPESIETYRKYATKYTKAALLKFYKKSEWCSENDNYLYRGIANVKYYRNKIHENNVDLISAYTGADEPISYFENKLLNSYTINERVAERFMMSKNSTRKAIVRAEQEPLLENIFSSFVVTEIFEERQYEILCLPNVEDLYISEDVNDSICAEFHISKFPKKQEKIVRKNLDI